MKGFLLVLLFFSVPCFPQAVQATDWYTLLKKENIKPESFTSQVKLEPPYDKRPPIWEIGQVLKKDFLGDGHSDLVVCFSAHDLEVFPPDEVSPVPWKGTVPLWGGFAFFSKEGQDWKLRQVEQLGITFEPMKVIDISGKEKGVLVTGEGGFEGANMTYAFRLNHAKFEKVLGIEVDGGYGPEIFHEKGKQILVVFQPTELLPANLWHERIYSWDGSQFSDGGDPISKGDEEYRLWETNFSQGDDNLSIEARNRKWRNGKSEFDKHYQELLSVYEGYLKDHPGSFMATAYCAWLCARIGDQEKEKLYEKKLFSMGSQSVEDCPHAWPKMKQWMRANQRDILKRIQEGNW